MDRDIAIIGMSCVFPGADNLDRFWWNNVNGVDAVGEIPAGRWPNVDFTRLPVGHSTRIGCTRGGFLPAGATIDARRYGLMPNLIQNADPDQFVMLAVIHKALTDAGVADEDPIRRRTDVVAARGGYMSVKMAETFLRVDLVSRVIPFLRERLPELGARGGAELEAMLHETLPPNDPESYVTCIPNLVASRVCNRLNLRGSAFVVDAACASALVGVEQAVERLRHGQCDLAVASGIHLCQNPPFWFVFTHLGALSGDGVIRPFDTRADGLLLGEGAGAVVLKRLEDAYRDGDRIYAVVKGAGSASDGREAGVLTPSSSGQVETLTRAYADAAVDPQSISLLEAHGTATAAGDAAEIETIRRFYGSSPARTRVIGSVKSMIGHAMPAAGMAALIRTSLALSNKVLPPTIHCEQPREELKETAFYVLDESRPWIHPIDGDPRRAGVNAFGFGGINAHVVLEEAPERNPLRTTLRVSRPFQDACRHPSEPVLFSAESPSALIERLRRLAAYLDQADDAELVDIAFSSMKQIDWDHEVKLAMTCGDLNELREMAERCVEQLEAGEDPTRDDERILYDSSAARPRGKLAVMFPGMAFPGLVGAFPKHLLQMCLHFPTLREALDRFEGKDGSPEDPIPLSCILSPPPSFDEETCERLERRVAPPESVKDRAIVADIQPWERNLAGVGMTLCNWMGWKLLQAFQVQPDMVCGQSAGDLVSMAAAGVLDYERDIVPQLWEGLKVPADYLACGCMAFVAAGQPQVEEYLSDKPDTQVAIDISPDAVLVGGPFDEIDQLCKQLRDVEIMAIGLPYLPGHTPLLSFMRKEVVYAVDDSKILGPPQTPAYSALTADLFPSDRPGIRESLMANLDHPVRFWQTNRRIYNDGARIFIQAGCGTLAANIESVLDDPSVVAASVDVEHRDPITQLCTMIGMLFTAGVSFDASPVFEHRNAKLIDFDQIKPPDEGPRGQVPLSLDWWFYSPDKDPTEDWPSEDEGAAESTPLESRDEAPVGERAPAEPPAPAEAPAPAKAPAKLDTIREVAQDEDATPDASSLPFVRNIVHFEPQHEIAVEYTLRLEEDLYLADHHFVNAASVKPLRDCLPVLPAVMMMEAMAEAAAHLAPGLGVIGLEDFRAARWVNLQETDEAAIRITASLAAVDEESGVRYVQAEIMHNDAVCATATILLAAEYQHELEMAFPELANPAPWPIDAEQLYRDKHTFHGPRFQTVAALDVLADNGLQGALRVLPKDDLFASTPDPQLLLDPAVIDGAGQLLGGWSQTRGGYMLPVAVDKLELYRPSPPPGSEAPIRLEITRYDLDANAAACDFEIQDGQGGVWMRVRGWRDRVFVKQCKFMEVHRAPEHDCFSTTRQVAGLPEGSVCTEITTDDLESGALAWIAALHLTADELKGMKRMVGKRRSEFLLGRIAVKDAVRQWIAQQSGADTMIHPAAISIGQRESGQPFVEPIAGADCLPEISLSHTDGRAVAVAAAAPVGIDVEPASRPTDEILDDFAAPEEAGIIRGLAAKQPDEAWATRFWCAKESASKAIGAGIGGQVRQYELVEVAADGRFCIRHRPTAQQMLAATVRHDDMIFAVSTLQETPVLQPLTSDLQPLTSNL